MTQRDADLKQLRLIDDLLEEEVIDQTDSDAFNVKIRQAIMAVERFGLSEGESALDRERDDAWEASLYGR